VSRPLVVLTGATGFIGSAVLAELVRRRVRVRAVSRNPRSGSGAGPVEWVGADLEDPRSLHSLCDGADALLHLAAYIGPDEARCRSANVHGGAALAAEAERAGVRRIVCLSTSAVYGHGPHRGIDVDESAPAPVSAASRSRLEAEQPFRAAGGVVLRAGLVLGAGDRWVVPALAELAHRVPARWDGGRARLSVVAVTDLARLVAQTGCSDAPLPEPVYHASHPIPVSTGELLDALAGHGLLPAVEEDLPWPQCLERLRAAPGKLSERQFHLLAQDHWYLSDRVWRAARCPVGPGPLERLAEAVTWYDAHLSGLPAPS
jgi:nucleoside-diphosphate-sugar epimerase